LLCLQQPLLRALRERGRQRISLRLLGI
jgi:hypothetical protein